MTPLIFGALLIAGGYLVLRSRNMHIWIVPYLLDVPRRWRWRPKGEVHVYFAFVDHYEPYRGGVEPDKARSLVRRWREEYPRIASNHSDSDGNPPQHTFFYPEEEYDPTILTDLEAICGEGVGDVEIHLHHDQDTAENLATTLTSFASLLNERHGFLRHDEAGKVGYAFIHGNWALDNSDNGHWCGVDNELSILADTGCYMDMTFPSAPSATQPKKINSIYFARGEPGQRQSHNRGTDMVVGEWGDPDELLLVQGPLMLNWKQRKFGLIPRIEAGEISADAPPSATRIQLWEASRIRISGADEHLFIKVHTHGAVEPTMDMLFDNGGFDQLWNGLAERFRDRAGYRLHYVTARQLYERLRQLALTDSGNG